MRKVYQVRRNGAVVMTAPFAVRPDGTLWYNRGGFDMPLFDGQDPELLKVGKEKIVEYCRLQCWDKIPKSCFARVGMSPTGLEVISCDDLRRQAEAALTPAQKERARIEALYRRANQRLYDTDDNNTMDHFRLRTEADAALAKWRKDYPLEAAEEDADGLIEQAKHEEELASGALVYDADGWLSPEEQQRRHDEHMAKARELRAKAAELREWIKKMEKVE